MIDALVSVFKGDHKLEAVAIMSGCHYVRMPASGTVCLSWILCEENTVNTGRNACQLPGKSGDGW